MKKLSQNQDPVEAWNEQAKKEGSHLERPDSEKEEIQVVFRPKMKQDSEKDE